LIPLVGLSLSKKGATVLFLAVISMAATGSSACGSVRTDAEPLTSTPTAVVAEHAFALPSTELAVAAVFDITTSADRFGPEAKALLANSLATWPAPGRGGVDVTLSVLSSRSWDAASQLLAVHLDGVPEKPVRRVSIPRPPTPDLEACSVHTFDRAKCVANATTSYNEALARAVADEARADSELRKDLGAFEHLFNQRKAEAAALAERITNLDLGHDSAGSDVSGALLRGAETLQRPKAAKRILLVQSDLVPFGRQQPAILDLRGIDVVTFFFDCPQGIDCGAHRQANEQAFLAAGASSVSWLDPGAARLTTSILEEVR
jgi:hypothetical protein